jgi:hypothetical protein
VTAAHTAIAWQEIRAKRQAIRDACTLPARFAALCDYQGALAAFAASHWPEFEQHFGHVPVPCAQAANEPAIDVAPAAGGKHRRTPAEIEALVARARELRAQTPRPSKARVAAALGISTGYLAALLASHAVESGR